MLQIHMLLQCLGILEHAPAFLALGPRMRIQLLCMIVNESLGGAFENILEPTHDNTLTILLMRGFIKIASINRGTTQPLQAAGYIN